MKTIFIDGGITHSSWQFVDFSLTYSQVEMNHSKKKKFRCNYYYHPYDNIHHIIILYFALHDFDRFNKNVYLPTAVDRVAFGSRVEIKIVIIKSC